MLVNFLSPGIFRTVKSSLPLRYSIRVHRGFRGPEHSENDPFTAGAVITDAVDDDFRTGDPHRGLLGRREAMGYPLGVDRVGQVVVWSSVFLCWIAEDHELGPASTGAMPIR